MRIKRMKLLALSLSFIGVLALGLYFLTPSFIQKPKPVSQNTFVINETKTANSLDVPLYPHASWKKIEENLKNEDGINQAMGFLKNYDYISIPFMHGTFYQAQSPLEYPTLESYYENELENEGWTADKIQFDTFTLQSLVADGPCGGVSGYMGYKENQVKIIAIQHELVSCGPPGPPDATPSINNLKPFAEYTIFISDPKPLEEIEEYIESNSKADL